MRRRFTPFLRQIGYNIIQITLQREDAMSFFGNRRQADSAPIAPPQKPQVITPVQPQTPVGFETVLGTNSTLEGHLSSSANVRLDGIFTGTLEIGGNVLVGETAQINADI